MNSGNRIGSVRSHANGKIEPVWDNNCADPTLCKQGLSLPLFWLTKFSLVLAV